MRRRVRHAPSARPEEYTNDILERKQAIEAQAAQAAAAKRPAADTLVERPVKATKPAAGEIPDEYLPPNRILFLREVHENYGKVELTAVFGRYPGFKEVRMVPSRKGIAFVEYDAEEGAIAAKEATAGIELEGKPVRVTFQKK